MGNITTADRRNKIAKLVYKNGSIRIGETAKLFNVSRETIRKDLIYLDGEKLVKKGHGGALAISDIMVRNISDRIEENLDVKNKIAEKALEFIPGKGVIILDPGSTTVCIARQLVLKSGLTIITNSVTIANTLAGSKNNVYITGGEFLESTMALVGFWTINAFKTVYPNVAFLGSSGVLNHNGPCAESFADADVKNCIIENSKVSIVVTDSTKFNQTAVVEYATWQDIDYLITDRGIPKDILDSISSKTKVIIV